MKKKLVFIIFGIISIFLVMSLSFFVSGEEEVKPTTDELKKDAGFTVTGDETENREYYNFAEYGEIDSSGNTDITAQLQACLNEHPSVFVPAGSYKLDGRVNLYTGNALKGEEGTIFLTHGNTPFGIIGTTVNEEYIMPENVLFADFAVESSVIPNDAGKPFIIDAYAIRNVTVDGLKAKNIGIANFASYDNGKVENTHSENIIVRNCEGDGGNSGNLAVWSGAEGIAFAHVVRFKAENCTVKNYLHGIQFWGDDSNYNGGGRYENLGRCRDGEISDCVIDNIGGGGFWGSMGVNVNCYDCTVSHCNDVGIDYEGCDQCEAIGNTVTDCANNFGTMQSICGHIEFKSNTSVLTKTSPYVNHYCHTNLTEPIIPQTEIIFENNTFIGEKESYVALSYYLMPFSNSFIFKNNTFQNTFLIPTYVNPDYSKNYYEIPFDIHNVTVTGNRFEFDKLDFSYSSAVYVAVRPVKDGENPDVLIENNEIDITDTSLNGITLYTPYKTDETVTGNNHAEHSDTLTAVIRGNKVTGGNLGLRVLNDLEGLTADITLENNIFDSAIFDGTVKYTIDGNKKTDGSELSEKDILIVSNLYTPDTDGKKGEMITTAAKIPENTNIFLDGKSEALWNGAEKENMTKKSGNAVKSVCFRTYRDETDETLVLYILAAVDKGATINRRDALRISFAPVSGAKSESDVFSYEFNVGGTVRSENFYGSYTIPEERTSELFELKLYIPKDSALYNEIAKENKIGFNLEYAPSGKYENGIGWASVSENVNTSGFGTLVFGNEPKQKLSADTLYGDVNGDGKIKGNDATILLKYLSDWDVEITESNSDCNNDGKIKGNDATLLLKYLAEWNVTLG